MNWLLLSFLPLKRVFTSKNVSLVAANGQFMFWKRKPYFELGGHEKVKDKIVEDMELARNVKRSGLKMKTMLGGDLVFCKMYNSFTEAYQGFSKNFYPGFSINPLIFILFILFIFTMFFAPIILITHNELAIIPIALVVISRFFIAISSKQNGVLSILLHPLQMIIMLWIGIVSVFKFKSNSLVWKERNI
jgi:chlorobactene glucosyltransferase